ncbi:hypothetical protein ABIB37_002071 [Agrococcus sp. UYP10]|uniref:hypothetical protein n=1 Tax=Agrococcus sp. UYP10 TaxID=1756355 RepID=UPI003396BEC7
MLDWLDLRDLFWEARWDGLVVLADALWATALSHWWFGALLLVVILTRSRRVWLRLLSNVGSAFVRGSSSS